MEPKAATERLVGAALVMGLLAAVGASVLFTWLGGEVLAGDTEALDLRLRVALHQVASPGLTQVMRWASLLGSPWLLVPLGLVLAALFAGRGWRRGALMVVVMMAGSLILDNSLKRLYGRVRPEPFFDYPLPTSFSFPSGHALLAVCFFGGLAVLLAPRLRSPPLRVAVWLIALGLIALIGVSRVYLGVHYPSDVLGGYAAGTVWVTSVALGDRLAGRRRARRAP
ncbi:MAG: phosphatase PAP2 family protein [Gemmatimonadales bacterium]